MTTYNEPPSRGELELEAATDKAYAARWWETHDDVAATARWMADNGHSADDLATFIEKPWKYTEEFVRAQDAYTEDGGVRAWVDTTPPERGQ